MEFTFDEIVVGNSYAKVTNAQFDAKNIAEFIIAHWDQVLDELAKDKSSAIDIAQAANLTAEDLE